MDIPTWSNQCVFRLDHKLEDLESENREIRYKAEEDLTNQIQYAQYCQTPGIILTFDFKKLPKSDGIGGNSNNTPIPVNAMRNIIKALKTMANFFFLELPLTDDYNNPDLEKEAINYWQTYSGRQPRFPGRKIKSEWCWKTKIEEKTKKDVKTFKKEQIYEKLVDTIGFTHPKDLRQPEDLQKINEFLKSSENPDACFNIWSFWNKLRFMSDQHSRLVAAIRLTAILPCDKIIDKWLGEPVKMLVIPTNIFIINNSGFPILPKSHQVVVKKFMTLKGIEVIIRTTGDDTYRSSVDCNGAEQYRSYVNHLKKQVEEADKNRVDKPYSTINSYQDYLQTPLQPLNDHLDANTYEVFERDPYKYNLYEFAVMDCIKDTIGADKTRKYNIILAGGGRGPIAQRIVHAVNLNNLENVRIIIIEKNPAACLTLKQRIAMDWDRKKSRNENGVLESVPKYDEKQNSDNIPERIVKLQKNRYMPEFVLIESDMRCAVEKVLKIIPERADLLVSELLGSFGCNELSPECLDSAQLMLKPDVGVSIPQSYTPFLAPVSTQKLFNELKTIGVSSRVKDYQYEQGYVVQMQNYTKLAEAKGLWSFEHPDQDVIKNAKQIYNKDGNLVDIQLENDLNRNERYQTVKFKCRVPGGTSLHGFAGYFECVLYKNHLMSINPATHSFGMFSWFPIYYPLRPADIVQHVKEGDEIEVAFWRRAHQTHVWYEYCLLSPKISKIHNFDGWVHKIGC